MAWISFVNGGYYCETCEKPAMIYRGDCTRCNTKIGTWQCPKCLQRIHRDSSKCQSCYPNETAPRRPW
jgi:predicted amidophosphoribosyltransferase